MAANNITGGVTVNGAPLDNYIRAQSAKEIGEVRQSENRIHAKKRAITKHNKNTSRSRSSSGEVVYSAGQRATHVLILGDLYPWERKAPFVRSGTSVLGAIEYDERTGMIRCHECDHWAPSLGQHVRSFHHITVRKYQARHGLRTGIGLCGPAHRKRLRESVGMNLKQHATVPREACPQRDVSTSRAAYRSNRGLGFSRTPGMDNLLGKCKAQRRTALLRLCTQLGRVPTRAELFSYVDPNGYHSLRPDRIKALFGVPIRSVLRGLGFIPRTVRGRVHKHKALQRS